MKPHDEFEAELAICERKDRISKLVRELDVLCLHPEVKDMARIAYVANEIAGLADIIAKHGVE